MCIKEHKSEQKTSLVMWAFSSMKTKAAKLFSESICSISFNWPRFAIIENSRGKRYTVSDMDLILCKKYIKTLIVGEKYKYKYKCIQSVPFFTK